MYITDAYKIYMFIYINLPGLVGCPSRIDRLYLCAEAKIPLNECPGYDIKQSDDVAPVLEFSGMWSTTLLPSLTGPL